MKHISKLIFLFSLCKIITACGIANPTSADDCKDDTLLQPQKDADYVHCCLMEMKNVQSKSCVPITSYQYKNIGKLKKNYEEDYEYDYSLDCNSSFLQICLIFLLSFILF